MSDSRVRVDPEACAGCGLCVSVCPSGTLAMAGDTAAVQAADCIGCGHCAAVCPTEAVALAESQAGDGWAEAFATFAPSGAMIQPGAFAPAALVDLLRSRRSCRIFEPQAVPGPVLEDLVRAAVTAPSGTNSQAWTFTVLAARPAVMALGQAVAEFFRRINRLAASRLIRRAYGLLGRSELEDYYREHYASVCQALADWDRDRTDRLFHGAPAAILVGSRPGASCPAEDALLATQNMLLAAHAMGLGTCLIGYAVEAMRHDRRVALAAGVPKGEPVYSVVALGWPGVAFARPTQRRRPLVRYKTA